MSTPSSPPQHYRNALPLETKDGVVYLNQGRGSFNIVITAQPQEWTRNLISGGGIYDIYEGRNLICEGLGEKQSEQLIDAHNATLK